MTKKINKNIGLSYKADNKLPAIIFKGNGIYADFYEAEFKKNKASYKVIQDAELLDKLSKLPIESEISPDLYELVAILLVHVYALDVKLKGLNIYGST